MVRRKEEEGREVGRRKEEGGGRREEEVSLPKEMPSKEMAFSNNEPDAQCAMGSCNVCGWKKKKLRRRQRGATFL